jgi:hypothetical protein
MKNVKSEMDEPEKTTGPSGCEAFLPLSCNIHIIFCIGQENRNTMII